MHLSETGQCLSDGGKYPTTMLYVPGRYLAARSCASRSRSMYRFLMICWGIVDKLRKTSMLEKWCEEAGVYKELEVCWTCRGLLALHSLVEPLIFNV